jgi:hypothetical protein
LRGIDQQVAKAENAVAGRTPVKRNRYVRLTGATKSVNRALEAKNRALAGVKGYLTNLPNPDPEQVIGAYSRLLHVEKSFRMSKSDLAARPDLPPQTRVHRGPPDAMKERGLRSWWV